MPLLEDGDLRLVVKGKGEKNKQTKPEMAPCHRSLVIVDLELRSGVDSILGPLGTKRKMLNDLVSALSEMQFGRNYMHEINKTYIFMCQIGSTMIAQRIERKKKKIKMTKF